MTKEEIQKYAEIVLKFNQVWLLNLKDETHITGYFDGNNHASTKVRNDWSFVKVPQANGAKEISILDGDLFQSIQTVDLQHNV